MATTAIPTITTTTNVFTDEIAQTKLLSALILFFMTLTCGYVPVRTIVNQNFIQYAMYGGGGVLMATAFCHLIPETHDNYKLLSISSSSSSSSNITSTSEWNGSDGHSISGTPVALSNITATTTTIPTTQSNITQIGHSDNNSSMTTNNSHENIIISDNNNNNIAYNALHLISSMNLPYVELTLCCGFFFMYIVELLMIRFVNTHTHQHPCDTSLVQLYDNSNNNNGGNNNNGATSSIVAGDHAVDTHHNHNHHVANGGGGGGGGGGGTGVIILGSGSYASSSTTKGTGFYKFIRGLLIVSAFGAHSLFDGVAIGSQESVEKVWTVFAAISCHKLIIAAVVGLELYAATLESHLWTVVHLSLFSIMSPIGIVLVVVAQNSLHLDSNHPAMILLQSFATGTLLYIIFVEILQPKGDHSLEKNRLGKSISLVAGFTLMLLVLTLMDED